MRKPFNATPLDVQTFRAAIAGLFNGSQTADTTVALLCNPACVRVLLCDRFVADKELEALRKEVESLRAQVPPPAPIPFPEGAGKR